MFFKHSILYLIFLFCLSSFTAPSFSAQVFAPSYPLTVQAKEHSEAHELVYFCNNYIIYLREKWDLKTQKISPVAIVATASDSEICSINYIPNGSVLIKINTSSPDFKIHLRRAITTVIIQDCIAGKDIIVPRTITYGIEAVFANIKVLPRYNEAYKKLSDSEYIPLDLLFSIRQDLSHETADIFRLQSAYLMEFFANYGIRGQKLIHFITNYSKDSSRAILDLANNSNCFTLESLELLFIESTVKKDVVYNIASVSEQLNKNDINDLIKEILEFTFYDPSLPSERDISRSAFDLTLADLPCIDPAEIDEKILMLRSLKESGILQEGIEHLITALEYLRKHDYESYYDHLYMAQRIL